MRKIYIIGNWKLNKSFNEIRTFFESFNDLLKDDTNLFNSNEIVYGFAPTFIGIPYAGSLMVGNTNIIAQDVCERGNGSYTGQVSAAQLLEHDVKYCIIGHSEARKFLGCNDKIVNAKAKALLASKMIPIICIGESLEQYNNNETKAVLLQQIKTIFDGISADDALNCVIAYEPLWAIGSGKTPTLEEINSLSKYFREVLTDIYDKNVALSMPLLYGGSVNENNAKSIVELSDVDGCLIGGVSLYPEKFIKILKDVK